MVTVRIAREVDTPVILRLWLEMMEHHAQLDPRLRLGADALDEQRQAVARLLQGPESVIFVAEVDSQVVGFLTAQVGTASPIYTFRRYGWIGDVGVATEHQRTGIGSQLASAALNWFREKQITVVQLNAAACNPKAKGFWEKVGFHPYLERLWMEFGTEGEGR